MALEAKKPVAKNDRIKLFMYGPSKIGKTTLALQFPKPYVIDTEGATEKPRYVRLVNESGGDALVTQDFDKIMAQVKDLLTLKHEYKTLVIDSLTGPYNDLVDKAALRGTEYNKHYREANMKMRPLIDLLLRLDMNVIVTCHSKADFGPNMTVIGNTYDGYKKLDYIFHLIIEIQKRGENRVALVKGSWLDEFSDGDTFPLSYDEFKKRYSMESLEREAIEEKLATGEQIQEIKELLGLLKVSRETQEKWLDKSKAHDWCDMSEQDIQKCIDYLKSKIQGEE